MRLLNTKLILSDKRHGWIDYDRGISIILVTYRHCFEGMEKAGMYLKGHPWLEYINVFFFGFRMPLFFIASGIFFSGSINKKGLLGYSNNRIQSILYPMLLWGFIQISLQIIFSGYTNSKGEINLSSYWNLIINPRATGQFWYLNALFFVGIIYAFSSTVFKIAGDKQLIIGIIFYACCSYNHANNIQLGFLDDIFKYYLFFSIGDNISRFMLNESTEKLFTSPRLIISLLITFLVIQFYFTKINMKAGDNYFIENHQPLFFLLVALIGCALSISISFTLKKTGKLKFLRVLGYNSIHIYCMQIIVMAVARIAFTRYLHIQNVSVLTILIMTVGLVFPVIFFNGCIRFNLWWLFTLKKPEKI